MCDNDSEDGLERWSSVKSVPDTFDKVPEETKFKMILLNKGVEVDRFHYKLKAGKDLPAKIILENKTNFRRTAVFSCQLVPAFEGYEAGIEKDGCWYFELKIECVDVSFSDSEESFGQASQETIGTGKHVLAKASSTFQQGSGSPSHAQKGKGSLSNPQQGSGPPSRPQQDCADTVSRQPEQLASTVEALPPTKPNTQKTPHSEPEWLDSLNQYFLELIVEGCSAMTRRAVENNEVLQKRDFRVVKEEIINAVMSYMKKFFNLQNLPGIRDMRQIAFKMSHVYPVMFCYKEGAEPGEEVAEKIEDLASKMRERLRGQLRTDERKHGHPSEAGVGEPAKKKGRIQVNYGTDSAKWNSNEKVGADAVAAFNGIQTENIYEKREEVFEKFRGALTALFKKSKQSIPNICKAFWKDPRHLACEWSYLTGADSLFQVVEDNYKTQFANIEKFLRNQNTSVEFLTSLANIEETCQVENSGSTTWKEINLLRFFSEHYDGSLASLIRMEADGEPDESGSPHIFVIETSKGTYVFELWVEGQKLLGNLNFVTAISSFIHLAFSFDLKYPRGGETAGDLLQRSFARYGDKNGTRTWRKLSTAAKKLDRYYSIIGQLS